MGQEALEHALGVLGDGKVVITLTNGSERVEVSRIAAEDQDNCPTDVPPPLVFSQKEIEQIGVRAESRLRLVDGFRSTLGLTATRKAPLVARVKSISTEIRSLLSEIDEISEKLLGLPKLKDKLVGLQQEGVKQGERSTEIERLRKSLEELSPRANAAGVRASSIERSATRLLDWIEDLDLQVERRPAIEPWPAQAASPDQLSEHRVREGAATQRLRQAIGEFRQIASDLSALRLRANEEKLAIDSKARELRQKIEEQQKGASILDRQIGDLSQEIAALTALADLKEERSDHIEALELQRAAVLDTLHAETQTQTSERHMVATHLSGKLAPAIRVEVKPLADYREYLSVLSGALRGSGLRYRELCERIVETFSPQEIAGLAERWDTDAICSALDISDDRAHRLADALRGDAGIDLLTSEVGDEVSIELLDGTSFKSTDFLSMGQRCTAVLPIILQHTERIIVLDQPEDHLDNAFIVGTLVQAIRSRSGSAQTVVATHNPNIPVLGGADWVGHLESDGERCFVHVAGHLDEGAIVESITTIMEGGREAFQRRAEFYAENSDPNDA